MTDENLEPEARVRRVVDVRRVIASAVSALAVLGLTAAVVLADDRLPGPTGPEVEPRTVALPAADQALVCPGPMRAVTAGAEGEDVAYDPQFAPTAAGSSTGLAAFIPGREPGELTGADGSTAVAAGSVVAAGDTDEAVLTVPGSAGAGTATASVLTRTPAGDLRGLAAAPCARPAAEHWLVGGSTALGSSLRLSLHNPGRTPASVGVELWGPAGAADLAGAPEFLVPAGETRVVLLEGLAAEQRRVVVRTTVRGGLVTAHLQAAEIRGLVPAGVDLVVPGSVPATQQVVVGLDVTASEPGGADAPALRLLAPDEDAEVDVTILGADGAVELPGASSLALAAGEVLDVPLGGLPAGAHAVVVRSTAPVVAGAMTARGNSVGRERASALDAVDVSWLPARSDAPEPALAVPGAELRRLVLAAPGGTAVDAVVRVRTTSDDVTSTEVVVPRRSVVTLDLEEDAGEPVVVEVEGQGLLWSVVLLEELDDGEVVAALTPLPATPVRDSLAVTVR